VYLIFPVEAYTWRVFLVMRRRFNTSFAFIVNSILH